MKTYQEFINERKKENPVREYWDRKKTKLKKRNGLILKVSLVD